MREAEVEVCDRPYRAFAAESFFDALLGVHRVSSGTEALVIPGSSVNGLTLRKPIWVFGVADSGCGTGGQLLRPGRIIRFVGAKHVIELVQGLGCMEEHVSHTVRWSG